MSALILHIVAHSLVAATCAWIGLMALVEGNRRSPVTRWFALTALMFALLHYSELATPLFARWAAFQQRALLGLIGGATIGWAGAAVAITRDAIPRQDWLGYRRRLVIVGAGAIVIALAGFFQPSLFFTPAARSESFLHYNGQALFLLSILQVQLTLGIALQIYLQAQWRWWSRHRLFIWFILASASAMIATLLMQLSIVDPSIVAWGSVAMPDEIRVLGLLGFLCYGGLALKAMTANRELLGRPIRARLLLLRWGLLMPLLTLLIFWELPQQPAERGFELLGLTIAMPLLWAAVDWFQHRAFRQTIEHYRRYSYESIGGWPVASEDRWHEKAQRIFDTLVQDLHADACSLHLQAGPHEPSFNLSHPASDARSEISATSDAPSAYYLREVKVEIEGQQLGVMKLRGPKGIAYSALELTLAEACAYHIASLYLHSRQVRMLEDFAVRGEDERNRHNQRLQRILHDRVLGDLDVIHKAAYLLAPADPELTDEIRESVRESESLIRGLLRGELADLHPPILLREGIIAALRTEVLPRYRGERYRHIQIAIDPGNLSDAKLNLRLGDDLKRKLYAAIEEVVRNAAKYADGGTRRMVAVCVALDLGERGLRVVIQDNGVGFVPELASSRNGGLGLSYYEVLLRTTGGAMSVKSQAETGTTVTIDLPATLLLDPQQNHKPGPTPTQIAHTALDWRNLMLEAEQHQSGRLLIKNHLSDLTRPLATTMHYHHNRTQDERETLQLIEIDVRRQRLFESYLARYPFKEIVDQSCLVHYIFTGKTEDGYSDGGKDLAREHVLRVIRLLQKYDNYHLGLSSRPFETNFAVKPGYAVLCEQRGQHGESKLAGFYEGICDTHPSTVAVFTRRFDEAWLELPPEFREKPHVIARLEQWLEEGKRYFT